MKLKQNSTLFNCLILTGLLAGCATPPPVLDTSKLPAIAEKIIDQAVYYNSLFSTCDKLGGDAEIQAISIQQDWLTANWPLVAAADQVYTKSHSAEAINYQNHLLSPIAIRMAQQAHIRAINELNLDQRSTTNQQKTCEFRFSKIDAESIKLTSDPEIATYANALLTEGQNPSDAITIARVPSLAGGVPLDLPVGKSYYHIAEEQEKKCADAYTLVMTNDWPHEAYANFCGNQLKEVLTCEWGNCTASEL